MKRNVTFVHTSPAAIQPMMKFFSKCVSELEITNLLDDGLLRLLASGYEGKVEARLLELLRTAFEVYGAELVVLTCSAVTRQMLRNLRAYSLQPLLKIDEPMARRAVAMGERIGVALTFAPTLELTRRLLLDAAVEAGRTVIILSEEIPGAYEALLTGDLETHDRLVLAGIAHLEKSGVDTIVLAQISMARVQPQAQVIASVPVLSSLDTCLEEIRKIMGLAQ